jgi:hypothetical protein
MADLQSVAQVLAQAECETSDYEVQMETLALLVRRCGSAWSGDEWPYCTWVGDSHRCLLSAYPHTEHVCRCGRLLAGTEQERRASLPGIFLWARDDFREHPLRTDGGELLDATDAASALTRAIAAELGVPLLFEEA